MAQTKIEELDNGNLLVTIQLTLKSTSNRRRIILPDGGDGGGNTGPEPMLLAVARGRRWQKLIDSGQFANARELARHIGRDPGNVAGTLRMAMLSPAVIHSIVTGEYPASLTIEKLRGQLPDLWEDQEALFLGK